MATVKMHCTTGHTEFATKTGILEKQNQFLPVLKKILHTLWK